MTPWTLPLVALSSIAGLSGNYIESSDHFAITTDTYASVWPWRSYKTSPHAPPKFNISRRPGDLSNGYIFLSPSDAQGVDGTYELSGTGFIMTMNGDLIYAAEERGYSFCEDWVAGMTDFRTQYYKGKQYITYWNGCNTKDAHWGHRWGRVTFIDEEYSNFTLNPDLGINTLDQANKGQIDMHEHQMTDDNTMVVTSYNNTLRNLTYMNGSSETWVADSMFFEFDIATQKVLFQWSAMDHMSLTDTHWSLTENRGTHRVPWDWFHINSVQKVGKDYLVSARHHFSVFMVSGEDGRIFWRLNGEDGGTFDSIPSRFRWQHHARAHNITEHGMTISLFNNHMSGAVKSKKTQTQALAFWLPLPPRPGHPPTLVRKLSSPNHFIWSATQGSYQMDVGNGNGFVGYGKVPLLREYGPAADLRWSAWFGHEGAVMSYRAFKADWHGTPKNWDPVAVFEPGQRNRRAHVYVSWNGATDLSHWAIFAGMTRYHLDPIGVTRKMGFETAISLDKYQCVQLGAVRDGQIIRASNIACQDDAPLVFQARPNSIGGGTDLSIIQSENEILEAELEELEAERMEVDFGVWVSYLTIGEVALAVVALVAALWGYRSWRERRRGGSGAAGGAAHEYQSLAEPLFSAHRRVTSGLSGFGLLNTNTHRHNLSLGGGEEKMKVSPLLPNDAAEFDEVKLNETSAAILTTGRRRHVVAASVDEGHFALTHDDDEDDDCDAGEEADVAHVRTPFMRQLTGA